MTFFKCKMCGGTIEFEPGSTVGICDSCGTKQTLPRLDTDRKMNLYDRANHFRRDNDFDKAMTIYEQILNEDNTDAEAYWSLVLCRYGIEYVEDPYSHKRVPTVNRAQFTSIYMDEDYKSALEYADVYQKQIYESEAKVIDDIQKGILEISSKEDPFDVFICYKETDNNGRRTQDSVLANDLYHQLTLEGFKVFFSRITLEDKLGTAYEPYIFAAINSAKVMVVLGTRSEYFNAVWVKNEWSRYLGLVKTSAGKKVLIPAYRDMDPYDLPEEFSHLQAQDMSKLGFMQDLIRGIKKIVSSDEPKVMVKETIKISENSNTAPLLKRAFMFLEDKDWKGADDYCERVLDQDPENAQAYLGKLLANLQVCRKEELANCEEPFDNNSNYQKAIRFGDKSFTSELKGYISHIVERNENNRLTDIYNNAVKAMNNADTENSYKSAARFFKTIPGFKDSDALAEQCLEKAETCRKDEIYNSARKIMGGMANEDINDYEAAITKFQLISGWRDSDDRVLMCQNRIEEIKTNKEIERLEQERKKKEQQLLSEKNAKKRKRTAIAIVSLIVLMVGIYLLIRQIVIPQLTYKKAISKFNSGQYIEALKGFESLSGFRDSDLLVLECKYNHALKLIDSSEYKAAIKLLDEISDYKDSKKKIKSCIELMDISVGDSLYFGLYEQDNDRSNGKEKIEWIVLKIDNGKAMIISKDLLDVYSLQANWEMELYWETRSLRTWLNHYFFLEAFNESERENIVLATVANGDSMDRRYLLDDTQDHIFTLCADDSFNFSTSLGTSFIGLPTKYALEQMSEVKDNSSIEIGNAWWVRDSIHNNINYDFSGVGVYDNESVWILDSDQLVPAYVRPVCWIYLWGDYDLLER